MLDTLQEARYLQRLEANKRWREAHPRYLKEYSKTYRQTPHGKEILRKANKKWRSKNRKRIRATDTLRYAVMKGTVVKADLCEHCHTDTLLHGHHPDYTKPLEVIWLCHQCHRAEHRRIALSRIP